MASTDVRPQGDLTDPTRVRAALRLTSTGIGHEGVSHLSALAAELLRVPHAQVSLLSDEQVIVAGSGLPDAAVGEPSPLEDSLCTVCVSQNAPLAVPDAPLDERVAALPPVTSGAVGAYLGTPLRDSSGNVVGALCVYDPSSRSWSDQDLEILSGLGRAVTAELELAAAHRSSSSATAQLEAVLAASETGTWEMDLTTGHITWDDRCAALFGFDPSLSHDSLPRVLEEYIHPEDRPKVAEHVQRSIEHDELYDLPYRIIHPSGEVRWLHGRGRLVRDESGVPVVFAGAVVDVTASRKQAQVELDLARRSATLAHVAIQLATVTSMAEIARVLVEDGLHSLSATAGSLGVMQEDGRGLRGFLLGYGERVATEFSNVPLDLDLPGVVSARTGERCLVQSPEDVSRYRDLGPALAGTGTLSSASVPLRVEDELLGSITVSWPEFREIPTEELDLLEALAAQAAQAVLRVQVAEQRDAARLEEQLSRERLELLVEAARSLSLTLDVEEAVGRLSQLVVPRLADWSIVTLVDEMGTLRDVGSWHRDPALRDMTSSYSRLRLSVLGPRSFVREALRTGEPVIATENATALITSQMSAHGPAAEILSVLSPASVGIFPLQARGRTVGLLSLFRSADRPPFAGSDVATATGLSSRAGLALDNVHLYDRQRRLAEELQRSLLTAPPEPDHAEVAVRYQPASQEAQVGGDWYDAFLQTDGSTVIVIGDVVGHDTRAAAAMGQVRGLLRGIAYTTGAGPAEVLTRLDRSLEGLLVGTMATAAVLRIEQTPEDRDNGLTRLRWSNAGHPPPMVLNPDGTTTLLDGPSSDLLLGILPETPRSEHELVVQRGSTVLMYTDGLVERRGQDLDAGISALAAHLGDLADRTLGELCDGVIERMLPVESEDDVALVAVRLHPQDRPRPPEAGPNVVPPGVDDE